VLGYNHPCDDPEDSELFDSVMKTAHLIAAAPKMYRMLIQTAKLMSRLYPHKETDLKIEDIHKLLAEARGEKT
jgi:hypothetical protein